MKDVKEKGTGTYPKRQYRANEKGYRIFINSTSYFLEVSQAKRKGSPDRGGRNLQPITQRTQNIMKETMRFIEQKRSAAKKKLKSKTEGHCNTGRLSKPGKNCWNYI